MGDDVLLFKTLTSTTLAVISSVALTVSMSMPANAVSHFSGSHKTVVSASGQAETDTLAEKMKSLKDGESFTYSSPTGENFKVTKNNGQLSFSSIRNLPTASPASSWCATSLAAVVFGIGATALAAAAVATGGGSVIIGGVTLSGAQLGGMAAVAGSFSALEAYIDSKVC